MAKVLDTNGTEIAVGAIVAKNKCGHTFRVLSVQPGKLGLVEVAHHGLVHCPNVEARDLLIGSEVTVLDAEPVLMHRDGLVAFG